MDTLDIEDPPPSCKSCDGSSEDGPQDEGDGQGNRDATPEKLRSMGWTDLKQPNLRQTVQARATRALRCPEEYSVPIS